MQAGSHCILTAKVDLASSYPSSPPKGNSLYLRDPIIYLRLPKGITLDGKESVVPYVTNYRRSNQTYTLEAEEYFLEQKDSADGKYTIYAVRFRDGAAGIGAYNEDYSESILKIDFHVFVGLGFSPTNLNTNETLFMTSEQFTEYAPNGNNARPKKNNVGIGKGDNPKNDMTEEVDFVRQDTGHLVTGSGSIPVKSAVRGILYYRGSNDPAEDGNLQNMVLDENTRTLSCEFSVWNNTANTQESSDADMAKFVNYVFLPRSGVKLPNMNKANDYDLYLTGPVENKSGFLTVEYTASSIPTENDAGMEWIATVDKWGAASSTEWMSAARITDWSSVTELRVTVNRSSGESIESKGTKSFLS